MSEKDLLKELVVEDENAIEILVSKVKNVMKITKSGTPVFLIPYGQLTDSQKLALHLASQYFSNKLRFSKKESLNLNELQKRASVKYKSASGRLSELLDQGIIHKTESNEYSISSLGIEMVVDEISKKFINRK